MKYVLQVIISVLLCILCAATAFAEMVDGVAAVVNRKVITLSQIRKTEGMFVAQQRFLPNETKAMRREKVLNFLIEEELARQYANELGVLVTSEEFDAAIADIKQRNNLISDEQLKSLVNQEGTTWDEFSTQIREQIRVAKLMNREVRGSVVVSEADILEFYESHLDRFPPAPISVHIRQILLKFDPNASETDELEVKGRADALVLELRDGADFQAIAQTHSEHPSAESGGELGTFKEGDLAAPYDAAFSMERGDISDPLRSDSGFLILYVEEKTGGADSAFENARERIRRRLYEEKSGTRYNEWLEDLKKKAFIDIK